MLMPFHPLAYRKESIELAGDLILFRLPETIQKLEL